MAPWLRVAGRASICTQTAPDLCIFVLANATAARSWATAGAFAPHITCR